MRQPEAAATMGRFVIPSAVEEWNGLGMEPAGSGATWTLAAHAVRLGRAESSRDIDGQAVGRMSGEANESVSDYSSPV